MERSRSPSLPCSSFSMIPRQAGIILKEEHGRLGDLLLSHPGLCSHSLLLELVTRKLGVKFSIQPELQSCNDFMPIIVS